MKFFGSYIMKLFNSNSENEIILTEDLSLEEIQARVDENPLATKLVLQATNDDLLELIFALGDKLERKQEILQQIKEIMCVVSLKNNRVIYNRDIGSIETAIEQIESHLGLKVPVSILIKSLTFLQGPRYFKSLGDLEESSKYIIQNKVVTIQTNVIPGRTFNEVQKLCPDVEDIGFFVNGPYPVAALIKALAEVDFSALKKVTLVSERHEAFEPDFAFNDNGLSEAIALLKDDVQVSLVKRTYTLGTYGGYKRECFENLGRDNQTYSYSFV